MLAPGALLQNRYRVTRRIGHGGMGAVYEALHEELGHTVALKETFHTDDEMLRKAFKREARLLAGLHHPSLPRVNDYFTEGDGLFLVMEYVSGEDLGELLKRHGGAFAVEEVLGWAEQLLDILHYLHTYDPPIIHRDIKPSNIKLTREGRIMLVDFGLAKGAVGASTSIVTSRSVLGFTLNYAPLEQILKADPNLVEHLSVIDAGKIERILKVGTDHRSDLYSVGATLYHLLTCKLPMQAPTRALSVWSGRPDPLLTGHELNDEIPPAVAFVLMRSLSLSSEERFSSASEMLRMVRAVRQSQGDTQKPHNGQTTEELPPTIVDSPLAQPKAARATLPEAPVLEPEPPPVSPVSEPEQMSAPAASAPQPPVPESLPLPARKQPEIKARPVKAPEIGYWHYLHVLFVGLVMTSVMLVIANLIFRRPELADAGRVFSVMLIGFTGGVVGAVSDLFFRRRFVPLHTLFVSGAIAGLFPLAGIVLAWDPWWYRNGNRVEIIGMSVIISLGAGIIPSLVGLGISKLSKRLMFGRVEKPTPADAGPLVIGLNKLLHVLFVMLLMLILFLIVVPGSLGIRINQPSFLIIIVAGLNAGMIGSITNVLFRKWSIKSLSLVGMGLLSGLYLLILSFVTEGPLVIEGPPPGSQPNGPLGMFAATILARAVMFGLLPVSIGFTLSDLSKLLLPKDLRDKI